MRTAFSDAALERCVLLLLTAWCFACLCLKIYTAGLFGSIQSLTPFAESDLRLFALLLALGALLGMTAANLARRRDKLPETTLTRLLCACFGGYSLATVPACGDPYYVAGLCGLWAVLLRYALRRDGNRSLRPGGLLSGRGMRLWLFAAALGFTLIVGGTGLLRYRTFRTPNFDFGIFAQIYEGMKRTGLPMATCERDRLLSHFAVHLSPILYLLLPVYWLFPHPVTLQVSQAAVLASAVIPLALLCRAKGLSPAKTLLLTAAALLHPAVAGGTNYDFHENCFLLPLLLWLFCLFEKGKTAPAFAAAALVLCVKEDAAVYVAFFALYMILEEKRFSLGAGLLALSAAWFLVSLKLLTAFGEGVMAGRYGNFICGGGGLWEAALNLLRSPGFALTQLTLDDRGGHQDKLLYLLQMLVPLGILPFTAKRPARLLLLLPAVLVNLLTLYPYQYQIGFQYSFGSTAFLLYLCALNAAEAKPRTARTALCYTAAACLLFTLHGALPRFAEYARYYAVNRAELAAMEEDLAALPPDAAVACSSFLAAHLAGHATLYETAYHDPADGRPLDYVIFTRDDPAEEIDRYTAAGYVPRNGDGPLLVLRPGDAPDG